MVGPQSAITDAVDLPPRAVVALLGENNAMPGCRWFLLHQGTYSTI